MKRGVKSRLAEFFRREWLPCLLTLALLGLNLAALKNLGVSHSLMSDDMSYVNSGVTLAKTGMLTMHDSAVPSAQIMPGMSALIAAVSLVFGEGKWLWAALKLLWCAMGALVGWFVYHSVRLYAPAWCACAATLVLARTDFLWCNNLILTETPTMLCFSVLLYATLQLGRTGQRRYFFLGGGAYFVSVLVRPNMAVNILFVAVYLLWVKFPPRRLLKQGLALALVMLCFFVPWTIRNAVQFKAFLPVGFGAGNPVLLGTYQGVGYPADEELDYAANVDAVMAEKSEKYLDEDGSVPYRYQKFLALEADGVKAGYRQKEWLRRDPAGFFASYLVLKPWEMMQGVFYWGQVWELPHNALKALQKLLLGTCALALATIFLRRKNRPQMLFFAAAYLGNILFFSLGFALDRYNIGVMPALCVLFGVGLEALGAAAKRVGRGLRLARP